MSISAKSAVVVEPLSLYDKLSLIWRVPLLRKSRSSNAPLQLQALMTNSIAIVLFALFASMYGSQNEVSGLYWRQKLALAFLRAGDRVFTKKQVAVRSRQPLTGSRIQDFCRKAKLVHRQVSLDCPALGNERGFPSAVLHFVTTPMAPSSGPTIFYFHGGGYHKPIQAVGHIPFAMLCAAACKARQTVFLEYSLAPEQPYPCQLVQAVAGLRFLLEKEGILAERLVLGGDSAGGHLAASLLAHIGSPSPYAPPIDLNGAQFMAVFLVSPWVTMSVGERDTEDLQARNDYLTNEKIRSFRAMFNPVWGEVWSNPFGAEDAQPLWKRLFPGSKDHAICRKAILAVGTAEVLLESCLGFGRSFLGFENVVVEAKDDFDLLKEKDFVLAIAPGEVHVQPGLDCAARYYDGKMMKAILALLKSA